MFLQYNCFKFKSIEMKLLSNFPVWQYKIADCDKLQHVAFIQKFKFKRADAKCQRSSNLIVLKYIKF